MLNVFKLSLVYKWLGSGMAKMRAILIFPGGTWGYPIVPELLHSFIDLAVVCKLLF